jgi:hypothetical protein
MAAWCCVRAYFFCLVFVFSAPSCVWVGLSSGRSVCALCAGAFALLSSPPPPPAFVSRQCQVSSVCALSLVPCELRLVSNF